MTDEWTPVPDQAPIVPGARFLVTCKCGFGYDSAKKTPAAAVKDAAHHGHPASDMTATAVDYHDHPLYQGRFRLTHPRVEKET